VYASLSPSQLFKRFFSNAFWYGLSIVLTRAGWLVLLPIYWTKLAPEDFGIIGVAHLLQVFLTALLGLGLSDAVQRFLLEWPESERGRSLFTLLTAVVMFSAGICVVVSLAGERLLALVFRQVPFEPYLQIAVWTAFFANLSLIPLAVLRIRERILAFSLLTIGAFATQATVGIYLVVYLDAGAEGYLRAALYSGGISCAVSLLVIGSEITPRFCWIELRRSFRYGAPTAVALVLEAFASALDRYFLDKHVALAQLGLYNLASQFGSAFNVFNQALKTSWFPFLYRANAERDDVADILGRFSVLYLALLAIPALAVALLAREFIEWFGGDRYRGVYPLVPLFVAYYYTYAIIAAMGRGMDLAKRTEMWPLVPTSGLIVSLTALFFLVPMWGVWGAIGGMILGATARAAVQIGLSVHYFPRRLYAARLFGVGSLTLTAFVLGNWLASGSTLASAVFKSIILAAYAPLVLWVGLGGPHVRDALDLILARKNG
jgi:O-antigen/teichoic acid export membrane protein